MERGPVSLFLLIEAGEHERYFINRGADAVVELRQVIRPRPDLEGNIIETNNFYRGDLERAFQDCPAAQRRAQQTSFNLSALQRAVQYYNNCRQPTASQPTKPSQPRVRLSAVYALPIYNSLQLGEGQGRVPTDDKLTGGYYTSAGVLLSLNGRYHNSHVAFITGLLCEINRSYATQQAYPNLRFNPLYQNSQVEVALDYLKLPLLLRYNWPGKVVRPYAEAGLYVRALLATRRNAVTDTYATTLPIYNGTYPLLNEHQSLIPAPTVGAGVRVGALGQRCFTVGAQAELASGPQLVNTPQHYAYTSQLLSVSVLLAYDLTN